MSKKIASGAQAILLDVKVGNGAFMENLEDARILAHLMVEIGKMAGRRTIALLSDMNQPLGAAVGNALELKEAIRTLKGGGAPDFVEHCLVVAGQMLALGGITANEHEGRLIAEATLRSGDGLKTFKKMVHAQGGNVSFVDEPERLPGARLVEQVRASRTGRMRVIHARKVGETVVMLGGGRAKKGDAIDYGVGVMVHKKVGDWVEADEEIFTIYANDEEKCRNAHSLLLGAIEWSDSTLEPPMALFYGKIE
jgi:pyrimidine-nucleoside phosphorylase